MLLQKHTDIVEKNKRHYDYLVKLNILEWVAKLNHYN